MWNELANWAQFIAGTVFWCWLLTATFDASRALTQRKTSGPGRLRTAAPMILTLTLGILAVVGGEWAARLKMLDSFDQPAVPVDRGKYKNIPAEVAESHSKSLAQHNFIFAGQLGEYFDHARGWTPWRPAQEDVEMRETGLLARGLWRTRVAQGRLAAQTMLVTTLLCIFLGWRIGRETT